MMGSATYVAKVVQMLRRQSKGTDIGLIGSYQTLIIPPSNPLPQQIIVQSSILLQYAMMNKLLFTRI